MKRLEEVFTNGSEGEQEEALKKAIRAQLDREFRSVMEEDLRKNHRISKTCDRPSTRVVPFSRKALSIAASLIILIGAALWLIPWNASNVEKLASSYIDEPFFHPGMTKGASDLDQTRTLAIESFNSDNYQSAIEFFQSMGANQSDEDKFYLALSLLKTHQTGESCGLFNRLNEKNSGGYQQEIRWYLSLCFILNNRPDDARKMLESFEPGDWKYFEAQNILEKLDK